jgi:hypothetical protein
LGIILNYGADPDFIRLPCKFGKIVDVKTNQVVPRVRGGATSHGWRVVDDDDYNQSVGEPQAEGVMSTAASFSLS